MKKKVLCKKVPHRCSLVVEALEKQILHGKSCVSVEIVTPKLDCTPNLVALC